MNPVTINDLKDLSIPPHGSHKGQNGRLLIIGGGPLSPAASLWALTVASRIVDLVHYSSVPENNEIVQNAKEEFRNGIVVHRQDLDSYIEEDDCILIGPGMTRDSETAEITNRLLKKHPQKQWVIDAGAIQMMDISLIPKNAILTPHHGEYATAFGTEKIENIAKKYSCIVLLKGEKDIVCSGEGCDTSTMEVSHPSSDPSSVCVPGDCRVIEGGNAGMTKGGTGDVLAGLIAALACKNDPFLATIAGSLINKKAGDILYKTVGPFYNATDLANEIPKTMKALLLR